MRYRLPIFVLAALIGATGAADAKCTRLAFSVNDYGKDGPTKDAKALLDKYIAQWTAERGIKKYTAGKKDVSCELFLDFGFFDEHTCKASATVCWGDNQPVQAKAGDPPSVGGNAAKAEKAAPAAANPAPAKAKAAASVGGVTTGTVAKTAPARPAAAAPAGTPAPSAGPALTPPKTQ
jgi:hypothetical protein